MPDNEFIRFFDIKFTRFITVAWISIIWILLIIAHFIALAYGLYSIVQWDMVARKGSWGPPPPPAWLYVVYPILVTGSLLFTRMFLELMIVLFRNEANTRVTKEHYMRVMKEKHMEPGLGTEDRGY